MVVQFQEFQVQHPVSSRRNRVTSLKPKVAELVHVPMASPGRTKTRFAWANAPCPVLHQSNYSSILFRARGGISIGHRRSGCPSRGGVLREYHRKTLKNGPLNGEPEKERERREKERQEEEGKRGWDEEAYGSWRLSRQCKRLDVTNNALTTPLRLLFVRGFLAIVIDVHDHL